MPSALSPSDCRGWNTSALQSDSAGNTLAALAGFNSCVSAGAGNDRSEDEVRGQPEVPPVADLKWNFLWLSVLIVATAAGNLMVCVAVYYERTLQNMSNYFLTSLAVVDFLVSIFIMPIGLVILVFGYFPLHPSVCVVWASLDVLMCTASIWHMCTLSVDRFLTLRFPIRYGRTRSRATMILKITSVWVISVLVCTPLTVSGFLDYSNVYSSTVCVPSMKQFVLFGSITAFYVPLVIMLVTYTLTVNILRRNHRLMKIISVSSFRRGRRPSFRPAVVGEGRKRGEGDRRGLCPGSLPAIAMVPLGGQMDTTSVTYLTPSSATHKGFKPSSDQQSPRTERRASGCGEEGPAAIACCREGLVASRLRPSAPTPPRRTQTVTSTPSMTTDPRMLLSSGPNWSPRRLRFSRSQPTLTDITRNPCVPAAAGAGPTPPLGSWSSVRMGYRDAASAASAKTVSELESVRNFEFLSASLNSVPRSQSTWSSGSWNDDDHVMFERLSFIEAEMDECLMDGVDDEERGTRTPTSAANEEVRKERRRKVDFKRPQEEMTSPVNIGDCLSKKSSKDVLFPASPSLTQWHSTVDNKDRLSGERKESVEAVSFRCGSVSMPVNLDNNWSKKNTPPNGLVHHHAIISADHKEDSVAANNSPVVFASHGVMSSGSNEPGAWLRSTNRPRSKDSESDVDFTKLIDLISESFGTRVKFVDNASSYRSSPVRKDACRDVIVTSVVTSPQRCSTTRSDDQLDGLLSYSLSSGVDDVDAAGKISIILTPEPTETSSGSEAELLFGSKRQVDLTAATIAECHDDDDLGSNLSLTRCLSESSCSSSEQHPLHSTGKISDGNGNFFEPLPPVTISSLDDGGSFRRSGNLCAVPGGSLSRLDGYFKSTFTNDRHYIRSKESLRDKHIAANRIKDDVNLACADRSPEFLTVLQAPKNLRDGNVDCNNSTTGTKARWMGGSNSSLTDDNSSEVIVGSSFHFNNFRKVTSKISCSDAFRMFCCTFFQGRSSSNREMRRRNGRPPQFVLSRKVSRNERKASKVLGIILLAFVIFWSPFFLVNILSVTCRSCDLWLDSTIVTCAVWWGYASSLANPVIYTLFSKAFRVAFRRILTCRCSYYTKRKDTWQKETRRKSGNTP